jgi:hypothetical protein
VKLTSQQEEMGPLGIGLEITKSNDVGKHSMQIMALEFGPAGLVGARKALHGEFPDVEAGRSQSMRSRVFEYLSDNGAASATTIADALDVNRANVSSLLKKDGERFVVVRKEGQSVLYGVKGGQDDNLGF